MAKKIGAIVSLVIIGLLLIATIVLANLKVDYSIKCNTPNEIWVGTKVATAEQKNEIINYIGDASNENRLTALFNGNWNKKVKLVTENGTIKYDDNNYYVRYHYAEEQQAKVGKETKDVKYSELVFTVSKMSEQLEYRVYLIPDATQSANYSHYYLLDANFEILYKYLENNFTK